MNPAADLPDEWAAELEAYYAGELSPEAARDLQNRLLADPGMAAAAARQEALYRHGLRPDANSLAERQRLRQSLNTLERDLPPVPAGQPRPRWLYRAAIAAGILLPLLAWWLLAQPDPAAKVADDHFAWLPSQERMLGSGDGEPDGPSLYDQKDYDRALPKLREGVASGALDSLNLLYAGVAALGSDRPAEARQLLAPLLESGQYPQEEAAIRYYLALAELQLGRPDAAVALLSGLPDQDPDITGRADRLRTAIQEME